MKFLTRIIDSILEASWERARKRNRGGNNVAAPIEATQSPRTTMVARTFTVKQALNGEFIEFVRHKWNPSGPDEYESCVYIVRENETLTDAIATVMVLMQKQGD